WATASSSRIPTSRAPAAAAKAFSSEATMASARTYFDVFGVAKKYHLDMSELEQRYHALSKELHPDRATPADRLAAVQKSGELNDGYRLLKDDRKRAEYLLKLAGLDLTDETFSKGTSKIALPPDFLIEIMEMREDLAAARTANETAKVAAMTETVERRA